MRITTILLLALLTCMSCGDDEEVVPEKTGNCLTAVINGEQFTAESTTGVFFETMIDYEGQGVVLSRQLTIQGTIPSLTETNKTINLTFACADLTTDLSLADTDPDCGVGMTYSETSFSNPNGSISTIATVGAINVETLTDDRIRGTFTFTAVDQNSVEYVITEGFFDTTIVQ